MYERTYRKKVLSQNAPPEKKRRRRFPWRRVLLSTLGVLAVAAIVILIRLPKLQVKSIDVVGTSVTDPEDVTRFINSQIEGNFLFVFPKKSMLLVPTASLTKWTARQFPRFATVDVRRKGVSGLIVTVSEYSGSYLWCAGAEDSCFFMTEDGLVFAPAPFFSGDAYLKLFLGEAQELPFSPLSDQQLSLVHFLLEQLPSLGIDPASIRSISEHQWDIEFSHNGTTARLMIDPNRPIEQTLEHVGSALATDPLKAKFKGSAHLSYLDARFENRVVYKFAE